VTLHFRMTRIIAVKLKHVNVFTALTTSGAITPLVKNGLLSMTQPVLPRYAVASELYFSMLMYPLFDRHLSFIVGLLQRERI